MLVNLDTKKFIRLLQQFEFVPGKARLSYILLRVEGNIFMSSIEVKDTQGPISATVAFLDAKGNATQPDDVPQWATSDPNVASVSASEDGMSATVTPTGALGAVVVTVDSTDTNGTQIHAEGTITVQSSEAVSGSVSFDTGGAAAAPLAEVPAPAEVTTPPAEAPAPEADPNQPL